MKASELRIGNWVSVNGIEGEVTISALSMFEDTQVAIDGIPLTEEWLLKFGFVKAWGLDNAWTDKNHLIEVYNFEGVEEYGNGEKRVKGMVEGDYAICTDDGFIPISCPFKYVHQLQNIYFALTGQELNPSTV